MGVGTTAPIYRLHVSGGMKTDTGTITIALIDSSRERVTAHDSTGWSARDSVVVYKYEVWEADDGPIGKGYSMPMRTATVMFRLKYVSNFGHRKRITIRSDTANGCYVLNANFRFRTIRNLTNPYLQGAGTIVGCTSRRAAPFSPLGERGFIAVDPAHEFTRRQIQTVEHVLPHFLLCHVQK